MKRLLAFRFLLLASAATSKAEGSYCGEIIDHGEPSGYRVVGFDGATNTWTIIRNGTFNGKYLVVRLTVACQAHKYADGDLLRGRDQCALQVGRLFHWYKSCDGGDFEMVSESAWFPLLQITEGRKPNQETQLFDILRYEALPDR